MSPTCELSSDFENIERVPSEIVINYLPQAPIDLSIWQVWCGMAQTAKHLTREFSDPASHILVVEDDPRVAQVLISLFEAEGYAVSTARTGRELMDDLKSKSISLITLDLGLAGEDGLSLARHVRTMSQVPIIMVTAKSSDIDRVVGLEIGADDYITKPFNLREVLARVRAVLRRTSPNQNEVSQSPRSKAFEFHNWYLDVASRQAQHKGENVLLTTQEFRLLEAFVLRPGRVLSRDQLLDFIRGNDAELLDRAIDTLVSRLRQKIEPDPSAPTLIKTVRSAGYIFTAKVNLVSG